MKKIFYNANIYTMNKHFPNADYMMVEGNSILEVGNGLNKAFYTSHELLDMNGLTIIPGLNDSHIHLLYYANHSNIVDLTKARVIDEIGMRLKEKIKKVQNEKWIFGYGWDESILAEKRYPLRDDLDKISDSIPIFIQRVCGHIAVVNSAAIGLMDLDKAQNPSGGLIDRSEDGTPTGVLKEEAMYMAFQKMPIKSIQNNARLLEKAIYDSNSFGLTSVQPLDMIQNSLNWEDIWNLYLELEKKKRLNIRAYLEADAYSPDDVNKLITAGFKTGKGSLLVKQGAVKMFMDGSLGGGTASLFQPYENEPGNKGMVIHEDAEIQEMVYLAHSAGLQIAIHAIGDQAIFSSLMAIKNAQECYPRSDTRHRIVHCQVVNKEILSLFKKLNVIADIQPRFLSSDLGWVEKKLGAERSKYAYAWKSFLKSNIKAIGGSDAPCDNINPFEGIYSAITRKNLNGLPENGWNPSEKLSVDEAVRLYTIDAAYASFEEKIKGTLEKGKLADFIVLDKDPYKIQPDDIKNIKVLQTYLAGRKIYG
ncbi:MAG: amidohydrolase [Clostridia bacterium]|nr:amidohydrolase [Clostridia bacterium]